MSRSLDPVLSSRFYTAGREISPLGLCSLRSAPWALHTSAEKSPEDAERQPGGGCSGSE